MSDEKPKTQADKFADLARKLGADEDEARFEETVKKVAKAPPPEKAD
jgi:hypothetical protein